MSAIQSGIFLAAFVIFILVFFYKWEIPFEISTGWLQIIGGFPCLLYSSFENFNLPSPRGHFPPVQPVRKLLWNCDKYLKDGHCLSTLTACPENQLNQFSVDFWDKGNVTCRRGGQRTECLNVAFENGMCRNLVVSIANYTDSVELIQDDFQLPASIFMSFESFPNKIENCYKQKNALEFNSENSIVSLLDFSAIRFEQNTTFRRAIHSRDCANLQSQLDVSGFKDILLCNCGKCDISISIDETYRENGTCIVPIELELSLPTEMGRVIGAVIRMRMADVEPTQPLSVTRKTLFISFASTVAQTRFRETKGRFYCPSEVTCWQELWYPLKEWAKLEISNIILTFFLAGLAAVALLKIT